MTNADTGTPIPQRVRFGLANLSIFLDEVVFFALAPLLPIYASAFALSKVEAGWLFASYPLLSFVAAIPGSLLCGRIGPRWTLVIANVVFALATLGFGVADGATALWAARAMQGLASGFTVVASMMIISSVGSSQRKGRVLGIAFALQGLSAIGGPALGGFVVPHLGAAASFAMVASVAATSAIVLVLTGTDNFERTPTRKMLISFAADARALATSNTGRYPVLLFIGIGVSAGCVQTLATLRLDALGVTTAQIGLLFMFGGILAIPIVVGIGLLCDRIGPIRTTRWWLICEVFLCLALATPFGLWVIIPTILLLLVQGRSGGTIAYVQAIGTEHARRIAVGFGFMVMAWAAGSTVGSVLAGAIAEVAGDSAAYVITAFLLIALVGPGASADLRARRAGPSTTKRTDTRW